MKAVKTILVIIVVTLIGFFVIKWLRNIDHAQDTDLPTNEYTKLDSILIDSLKKMPVNKFCKQYYLEIQSTIADHFKDSDLGLTYYKDGGIWKSGKDDNLNKQWNDILCKNLFSAYAPKFVEQAMYVFSRSEWNIKDLEFIRSEVQLLRQSKYLGTTGLITSFDSINTILMKYYEINAFVNDCKMFKCPDSELNISFPDVSVRVIKSRQYISNNLDNSYVNNCTRLKEEVQGIPEILFEKHVDYLTKIINKHGPRYKEFPDQASYSNSIYSPLKNQCEGLNNDVYGISELVFSNGQNSVLALLDKYNKDAYALFSKKH